MPNMYYKAQPETQKHILLECYPETKQCLKDEIGIGISDDIILMKKAALDPWEHQIYSVYRCVIIKNHLDFKYKETSDNVIVIRFNLKVRKYLEIFLPP